MNTRTGIWKLNCNFATSNNLLCNTEKQEALIKEQLYPEWTFYLNLTADFFNLASAVI